MGLSTNILHLDRFRPDIFIHFPWDRGGYNDENGCLFRASLLRQHNHWGSPSGASPWDHDFFLKWNWGYRCPIDNLLVGGWEPWNFMTFHSVGNFIIPTDELHHFSEGLKLPPTRYPFLFFDISHRWIMLQFTSNIIKKNHQPHHQFSVPGSIPCCITWVSPCDLPFFHGEISNVLALQVRARNRLEASAIPDAEGRKSDAMEFLQKLPSAMPVICFGSTWQHGEWNSKMMV